MLIKNAELIQGLLILGNYSQYVDVRNGMIIAGPNDDRALDKIVMTDEDHHMLRAAGWIFVPLYSRWCYIV